MESITRDWDGQNFFQPGTRVLFSVKGFTANYFERAALLSSSLISGLWALHFLKVHGIIKSIWNVGGGKTCARPGAEKMGSTTSEGKDLRDVAYANYFPGNV